MIEMASSNILYSLSIYYCTTHDQPFEERSINTKLYMIFMTHNINNSMCPAYRDVPHAQNRLNC